MYMLPRVLDDDFEDRQMNKTCSILTRGKL